MALVGRGESRPDFAAPISASMPEKLTAPQPLQPQFLVQTDDDELMRTERSSIRLYTAWKEAGGSAELYIYSKGGQGC